jgi:hypothetical protein
MVLKTIFNYLMIFRVKMRSWMMVIIMILPYLFLLRKFKLLFSLWKVLKLMDLTTRGGSHGGAPTRRQWRRDKPPPTGAPPP